MACRYSAWVTRRRTGPARPGFFAWRAPAAMREDLFRLVCARRLPGTHVMAVGERQGLALSRQLHEAGISVLRRKVYAARPMRVLPADIAADSGGGKTPGRFVLFRGNGPRLRPAAAAKHRRDHRLRAEPGGRFGPRWLALGGNSCRCSPHRSRSDGVIVMSDSETISSPEPVPAETAVPACAEPVPAAPRAAPFALALSAAGADCAARRGGGIFVVPAAGGGGQCHAARGAAGAGRRSAPACDPDAAGFGQRRRARRTSR